MLCLRPDFPIGQGQNALNTKAKGNTKSRSNTTSDCTIAGSEISEISSDGAVETFGETLPGLMLESVVDPDRPDHLLLHTWDGHRTTTGPKIERASVSYIPKKLGNGLVQSIRFAPPSLPFGSPAKLISSMRDFLFTYAHLQPAAAALLVALAVSTWSATACPWRRSFTYLDQIAQSATSCAFSGVSVDVQFC